METIAWLGAIGFAVVILILGSTLSQFPRRIGKSVRRSDELEHTFGEEEYAHVVTEFGTWSGENALEHWKAEADHVPHHELTTEEVRRFAEERAHAREKLSEGPEVALSELEVVLAEVEDALGYPTDDFEHTAALLSIDHPSAAHHIREAHALAERVAHDHASPDEARVAVSHYDEAIEELVSSASRRDGGG